MPFYPDRNWEEVFQTGQFFTPRVIQMLMELDAQVRAGGGSGSVNSVAAEDGSIVVDGTATDPTIRTGTIDVIATLHAAAADWSNAGFKITGLAAGTNPTDAANVSQLSGGSGSRTATSSVGASDAEAPTDWDYTCDGTADQAEILAAIAALPAGGGRVILSEGTFNLTASIVIDKSNVTLQGQGASTNIVLGNAVNANVISLGTGAGSFTDIKVSSLTVAGNGANQTGSSSRDGIHVKTDVTRAIIRDCIVANSRTSNIFVEGPRALVQGCTCDTTIIDSNIHFDSGSQGGRVEGCYTNGGATYGIQVYEETSVTGCYVNHNIAAGYGIYDNSEWNTISSNVVNIGSSGFRGIRAAKYSVIDGNVVLNASTADNAYCIYHNSFGMTVTNNTCYFSGDTGAGTGAGGIAIDEESTCSGNTVVIIGDRTCNGIEDLAGNSTITANSIYFVTGAAGTYNGILVSSNSVCAENWISATNGTVTGINTSNSDRCVIKGNWLNGCVNGITLNTGTDRAIVQGNMVNGDSSTTVVGISLVNCNYCSINDNTVDRIYHDGITLARSSYCTVNNNHVLDCGQTTNNTYSGIKLSASAGNNSTYNTVEGNVIRSTTANKLKYGIEENDSSQGPNIILGNIALGSVTANILVQHASTDYSHNITS